MLVRLAIAGSLLVSILAQTSTAQVQKFPYEAAVTGEDVYLRSGPGKKMYPTDRLKSGDRVIVHRHDPGGWYMIAPPTGSFSLIQADAVKPLGGQRGLVIANNVPVQVGSTLGEAKEVEQVRLSTNEEVQMYDAAPIAVGGQRYYRIVPPRGEYRWVLGQYLTPVDANVRRQYDKDPFSTPSSAKPIAGETSTGLAGNTGTLAQIDIDEDAAGFGAKPRPAPLSAKPVAKTESLATPAEVKATPDAERFKAERQKLADLDNGLRTMLAGDIQTWQLEPYDAAYRQLAQTATLPTMARQVEPRLATIAQHLELRKEYDELVRLTEATNQRDAALVAQLGPQANSVAAFRPASGNPGGTAAPSGDPSANPFETPMSNPGSNALTATEPPASTGNPGDGFLPPIVQEPLALGTNPAAGPTFGEPPSPNPFENLEPPMTVVASPSAPNTTVPPMTNGVPPGVNFPPATPQFSGAGIVRKTQPIGPGAPAYVLVSPQGQVLAFLQPGAGVNLDAMVGKPMGVVGPRVKRPDLRGDLISVQDASPVRLAPR